MNLFEGFVGGFLKVPVDNEHVVLGGSPVVKPPTVIERLCKEVGLNVEERDGSTIWLHFKDPIIGIRKIMIVSSDVGKIAVFLVKSAVCIQGQQYQPEILRHLMGRNADLMIGAWHLKDPGGDKITYALQHSVFTGGLDAAEFMAICEIMIEESHAFDAKLRSDGLL